MLILLNEAADYWEIQAETGAEWGFINNLCRALEPGQVISALPQEKANGEVFLILSPANGFPRFTPSKFELIGTTETDKTNLRALGRLVYTMKQSLMILEKFPQKPGEEEAPKLRLCGELCSRCVGPISTPTLIDGCVCKFCFTAPVIGS